VVCQGTIWSRPAETNHTRPGKDAAAASAGLSGAPGRPRALYLMLNGWGPGMVRIASPMDLQARWLANHADVLTATVFLTGMGSPGHGADRAVRGRPERDRQEVPR
jgi:hypothetical protein